jgi:glutaredoxin
MHEQKFRMKLQNKSLATKSNLRKRGLSDQGKCPYCTSIETVAHFWNCPNTTSQIPQIYISFKKNLQTRHSIKYETIDLHTIPEVLQIIDKLGINENPLTNTDGLITNEMIQKTKQIPWPDDRSYLKSKSRSDLMFMILDCWYNALYRTIWIPRNHIIYQPVGPEPRTRPNRRNTQNTQSTIIPRNDLQRRRNTRLHNNYYRRTRKRKKSEIPTTSNPLNDTIQQEPSRRIPILIIKTNPANPLTYTSTQRNNSTS